MIIKEIYDELINDLKPHRITENARRNKENPFGYVIDYIKDMYNISKTDGWDTAEAVLEHFNIPKIFPENL